MAIILGRTRLRVRNQWCGEQLGILQRLVKSYLPPFDRSASESSPYARFLQLLSLRHQGYYILGQPLSTGYDMFSTHVWIGLE